MMRRSIVTLVIAVLFAGLGVAQAGSLVLTSQGHLYRVTESESGLVLSHTAPDVAAVDNLIPQTVGVSVDTVELVVDEKTATPFVLWTDSVDGLSAVRLAALVDGAWFGPVVLGGEDGTTVSNVAAMVHTAHNVIDNGPDEEPEVLETTFVHTVWWRHDDVTALGHAIYLAIPLADDGMPQLDEATPQDLENLLPYGFACDDSPDVAGLTSARFFTGEGGKPQLFTPDFADCVFHLLGIDYEVVEEDVPDTNTKRRRQIAVFHAGDVVMAIPPGIDLQNSKMFLSHEDSVLIYWEAPDQQSIDWILSGVQGWTDTKVLPLGGDIDHERAVELLRSVAR